MLTTTFALLRKHDACVNGFKKLAKHLGGVTKYGADTPIDLLTVLDSNGVADTLWTLRATREPEAAIDVARRFSLDCATHVLPVFEARYPAHMRPRKAIQAVHDYRAGKITVTVLRAAAAAAYAAAYSAAADAAYAAAAYSAAAAADAAADAAYAAAAYADAAAAYAAEQKWQADRLAEYLRGDPELLALPERRAR